MGNLLVVTIGNGVSGYLGKMFKVAGHSKSVGMVAQSGMVILIGRIHHERLVLHCDWLGAKDEPCDWLVVCWEPCSRGDLFAKSVGLYIMVSVC